MTRISLRLWLWVWLWAAMSGGWLVGLPSANADVVLDWNSTLRRVIQHDGTNAVNLANPGWSTRSMAMANGAIYDAFQAVHRTHAPLLYANLAMPGTSLDAAVHQAAYDVLRQAYPGESAILDADYSARMALIPNGTGKSNGISLGADIAAAYIAARANDRANDMVPYVPGTNPGEWRPQPGQSAWGPGWGAVTPFVIASTTPYVDALPPIPALHSQAYTDAFHMVKQYGDVNSVVRTADQEEMALFWAYDRPTMGPPPVLFNRNLSDIAVQAGNTTVENARLFALASASMADAAIAAWDAKFKYNLWRPIAAIHEADADGNPDTIQDVDWRPLGAPGVDPNSSADDFTPPFPAWTSGHATMGAALFKAIELFYGTNQFDAIDGVLGDDPHYTLTSQEFNADGVLGMARNYTTFTQMGDLDIGTENSPEGENGTSRIYLGIHWIFDQRDGATLGNNIAAFVASHSFLALPEPSTFCIASLACALVASRRRASTRSVGPR